MESSQFRENVYAVIHDAAVATWQGVKESETVKALLRAKEAEAAKASQQTKETVLN